MNIKTFIKSKTFIILAAVAVALWVLWIGEYLQAQSLLQKSAQTQAENIRLSNQIENMQNQYQAMQEQYRQMQNEYIELQKNINAIQSAAEEKARHRKVAYLTFDDGPSIYTPRLLDLLKQNKVKATFFVTFQNRDSPGKRAILKREAEEGNAIGVHCWDHNYKVIYANEQSFLDDFNKMKIVIQDVTGISPKISRFPGGTGNSASITASHEQIMPKLVADVQAMGIKPFDWNVGGEDELETDITISELERDILLGAQGKEKVVILLHDTQKTSIEAVPGIVSGLRAKGYVFETLTPDSPSMMEPFAK